MRSIVGLVVICCCVLTVAGCGPSKAERDAQAMQMAARFAANEAEFAKMQTDPKCLASTWFLKEYSQFPNGIFIWNNMTMRLLALHLLLWSVVSLVAGANQDSDTQKKEVGWGTFAGGTLGLLALWVVVWLLCSIVVPIFLAGSYIPFWFIGFWVAAGVWIAIITFGGVLLIHYLARQIGGGEVSYRSSGATSISGSTRTGRVFKAMAKALFVAIASGIGGQLGGYVGGIIVFVISAGVCSIIEFTPPPADHH